MVSGASGLLSLALKARVLLTMSSFSSSSQRLGISPELRMLLMSSKKSSSTIWLSVKRKVIDRSLSEHYLIRFFKNSRKALKL